jgi:predicted dehydrogenase
MSSEKVRFGVIGLGHIAQVAVLPAFKHATERCELVALASSDQKKLSELSKHYEIENSASYDDFERVFEIAGVNAAYIAVPNSLHREFTERCARAGIHVLCEKPMAMTSKDCEAMILACDENGVLLMTAYRLHFESANLRAIESAQSGEIGELLFFSSTFGHEVRAGDIRTQAELGGGALFDLGVYCVNAARNLFGEEPEEVFGVQAFGRDPRFEDVDQMTSALVRFSNGRIAQFTASQSSADVSEYRLVGTKGELRLDPAYEYYDELKYTLTVDGKTKVQEFPKSDQFAPELLHFADCILNDRDPEPSGEEGLADVRVLEAIAESARSSEPVKLAPFTRSRRPGRELEQRKPAVRRPKVVRAPSPSK